METIMAAPKLQPALLGGLFAGVLSALPFVNMANCCCLWMIAGGVIAAYVMQINHPLPVTIGTAATVGFLAGLIGAIVTFALDIPIRTFVMPLVPQLGGWHARRDVPPEVRDALRNISPQLIAVIGGLIFACFELFFSTLGGMVGALVFRKPTPPSTPPMQPPSPPPPPVTPPAGPPVEAWSYPDQDQKPTS
jgi:hypothetical protein